MWKPRILRLFEGRVMEARWYQDEGSQKLFERVQVEGVNPIIALPTGAGKTHVIALLIEKYRADYPDRKIVVLSHVKEILTQNHASLAKYLGVGIALNSAMLNRREIGRITVAGIQSVYKNPEAFGDVGLAIIDEAHLVTDTNTGMYRSFLTALHCPVVGLTATPFRPRGYLHTVDNALFTEIAYDLTSSESYQRLIKEGYLSKLYCKSTKLKMDTSDIPTTAGDFNNKALDLKFNTNQVTENALKEVLDICGPYKKILLFAISIEHATAIQEWLNEHGINTGIVHSKTGEDEQRDRVLADFRSGFYRAIVNVNVLTTGLDIIDIDLVVLLRPTQSPVVYVQSVGRGMRVAPDKDHCLVLDFANNVATHGPIDAVKIKEKGEKRKGEPITKVCDKCGVIVHPTCKVCPACLTPFIFKVKINNTASNLDIIGVPKERWIDVNYMHVKRHKKKGKPDSIRIDYTCGLRRFSQWIAVRSSTWDAAYAAKHTLSPFYDFPEGFIITVESILEIKDEMKTPTRIFVDESDTYPKIENMEF